MNTPGSTAHVTDVDIERFSSKTLPADAIVPLTDHLADCADCQRRLSRYCNLQAALGSFGHVWEGSNDHVAESDVHAFVDGRLDNARRMEIVAHLGRCAACRDEVSDLQGSAAALPVSGRFPSVWRYGGLAAAAILLLALAVSILPRTNTAQTDTVLNDANGPVSFDARGTLQLAGLSPEDAERLRPTLSSGRLSFPSYLHDLAGTRGVLRGNAPTAGFGLVGPVGTAVLDDRPTLRWTSASQSATYIVTLQEELTGETVSSPVLRALEWTPGSPLTRGRTYLWQVAASFDGREAVTPLPTDAPAKLLVLSAADALRVAQTPPLHLVRGIVYAEVGLFDEAEREFSVLSAQNPRSVLAEGLLKQVKELRGRAASSDSR